MKPTTPPSSRQARRAVTLTLFALAVPLLVAQTCALTVRTTTPVAQQTARTGVRVMPLGDSITDGWEVAGGYRTLLLPRLARDGYTVDFVGSLRNGPDSLADRDHEGHSGWRIDEIAARLDGWLDTYQPEVILLMIGTNDMIQNHHVDRAPDRLAALLDRIRVKRPRTHVLVASLPPLANSAQNSSVEKFNAALPAIVKARAARGARISLVPVATTLTLADLPDGVHPKEGGYAKLAEVWYTSLRRVLPKPAPAGN